MALLIAGERSGVGKTTVTLAMLAALRRRSPRIQSFKVGPDYIDPMFHHYITGRPCRNLDPVLTSEAYVCSCFTRHQQTSDYALIEGVMGLFDGLNLRALSPDIAAALAPETSLRDAPGPEAGAEAGAEAGDFGSPAHVARLLGIPVMLVIDCGRMSASVAAIVHGYRSLNPQLQFAGVVLNRVGSDRHLTLLKSALAPLHVPILGVLRRDSAIELPDRHLGLVPSNELPALDRILDQLADLGEQCFDWQALEPLARSPANPPGGAAYAITRPKSVATSTVRIAIAQDTAFNFYYADNLDILESLGAELIPWSPLTEPLPAQVQGLYFGGGFPEMFAEALAANQAGRDSVRAAITAGLPTYAECGGLMYLCEAIVDFEERSFPMVGAIRNQAIMGKRLTLGYRSAQVQRDSLGIRPGDRLRGHEFHRSALATPINQSALFQMQGTDTGKGQGYNEGYGNPNFFGSYLHLHWGDQRSVPEAFVQECLRNVLAQHPREPAFR
jgi:cobyrinic acid a,c-diamide synthase